MCRPTGDSHQRAEATSCDATSGNSRCVDIQPEDVSDDLGLGGNSYRLMSVTASYSVAPSALPVKRAGFHTGYGRSSIHENLEPAEDHALAVEGHRVRVRLETGIGHDLRHRLVANFA